MSTPNHRAVGLVTSQQAVETALQALQTHGLAMDHVSVVGRDPYSTPMEPRYSGNKADETAVAGAVTGGALGGIAGLLVGLGTVLLPGVGPIVLGGAIASTLVATVSGTAIGAATGGLMGALMGLGIPEEQAQIYHDRIAHGDFLILVDGSSADIERAQAILQAQGVHDWDVYPLQAAQSEVVDRSITS